jgi:hypothetical protein
MVRHAPPTCRPPSPDTAVDTEWPLFDRLGLTIVMSRHSVWPQQCNASCVTR